MVMRCFECPEELWNEAKYKLSQTNYDSMSEALRTKLREISELEAPSKEKGILEMVDFSNKQEKVTKYLIKEQISNESLSFLISKIEEEGIYNRDDYVKRALEKISRADIIPFKKEGRSIVSKEIKCTCGSKIEASGLGNSNGNCPKCGRNIIDLSKKDMGLEVIG